MSAATATRPLYSYPPDDRADRIRGVIGQAAGSYRPVSSAALAATVTIVAMPVRSSGVTHMHRGAPLGLAMVADHGTTHEVLLILSSGGQLVAVPVAHIVSVTATSPEPVPDGNPMPTSIAERIAQTRRVWAGAVCAVCGGPAHYSGVIGAVIHRDDEDWQDNPHNVVEVPR